MSLTNSHRNKKKGEMELQLKHFSHEHALIFKEEPTHESDEYACCSGCGKVASGPSFSCMECRFYLHKKCAKVPSEIKHPFHRDRNHNFKLLSSPPYEGTSLCCFCDKLCKNFVYQCSCGLSLHLDCASFSHKIAEKKFEEVDHIAHIDPLISSTEISNEELKNAKCYGCWKPLLDSAYFSLDCGFCLHRKCAELPLEINHSLHQPRSRLFYFHSSKLFLQFDGTSLRCQICRKTPRGLVYRCLDCKFVLHIECAEIPIKINLPYHRRHPFILQFNSEKFPCQNCQETPKPFAYCCSSCKLAIHVECISPPLVIEDESHQHPFNLFWKQLPFFCDACGTPGTCISYICLTCGLTVHKKCISLPRVINLPRHKHPINHINFLGEDGLKKKRCRICDGKVNTDYGVYNCSSCNYICHVICAIEDYKSYIFDESKEIVEQSLGSIISVIKESKVGNNVIATEIRHFSHQHNLVLSDDIEDDKRCDGCILFISAPYYHCSQCDFFLHKSCAEVPRKMKLWFHIHQRPLTLISDFIFVCGVCNYECSGFAYKCELCKSYICLRCALVSSDHASEGHKHRLVFYENKSAQCNACGERSMVPYWCSDCNFALHDKCLKLPHIARHKCDEHPLKLTYHEDNDYAQHHYCDICEKRRNSKNWFYSCTICDSSAHTDCVLQEYPFIKPGTTYKEGDHSHQPLVIVRKVYHYPDCHICCKPCQDLALECAETGCNYIVHWKCINNSSSV
ncbi:Cysteine/Histidine-rich C1 domain family protein, putative [Theobroma cacao]|uniref:Cysteine/Histidine-rich C1 domain family protein, putative n=1 Tax=Theobroma cacao TaxID=3641 RepID=A0A061FNN2_THECC|nr:Cysteine/Histidine-rich C1 domain family protein, putative [Theobroma cacao]